MTVVTFLKKSLSEAKCPYCRSRLLAESVACPQCSALYHSDCWEQSGRCSVYGCTGKERGDFIDPFEPLAMLFRSLGLAITIAISSELLSKFWAGSKVGLFLTVLSFSWIVQSLYKGYTYYEGVVTRRHDPFKYWFALLLCGLFLYIGIQALI